MNQAPPGWYPAQGVLRWWDGSTWTQHTLPLPADAAYAAGQTGVPVGPGANTWTGVTGGQLPANASPVPSRTVWDTAQAGPPMLSSPGAAGSSAAPGARASRAGRPTARQASRRGILAAAVAVTAALAFTGGILLVNRGTPHAQDDVSQVTPATMQAEPPQPAPLTPTEKWSQAASQLARASGLIADPDATLTCTPPDPWPTDSGGIINFGCTVTGGSGEWLVPVSVWTRGGDFALKVGDQVAEASTYGIPTP